MNSTRTFIAAALLALAVVAASAQRPRPAITGISHMCVLARDPAASADFYARVLGATRGPDPQDPAGARFYFSPTQFVEVLPLPADPAGLSRISCVAFNTTSASGLRDYLLSKQQPNVTALHTATDGSHWFATSDPEGNQVQFVQPGKSAIVIDNAKSISHRVIHVGYLVKNRADEDRFYRDILGFRPYWFGAMQPDHIDWVSLQVPDGHDWIEYMMVGDGSDTPAGHVDARTLGVLNHFSLGVPNMEAAVTTLYRDDRLPPRHDGPQMGRDGKWQANLYDPDGTRVELMEFQPVTKPCCSAFTASSPTH